MILLKDKLYIYCEATKLKKSIGIYLMSSLYSAAYLMVVLLVDLRITHTEHLFAIPVAALKITHTEHLPTVLFSGLRITQHVLSS